MRHLTAKSFEEGVERRVAAAQSNRSHRDFVTWRWDGSLWKMLSVKQKAVKINLTKVFMILNTCLMKALSQNPPFFWTINGFFQHLVSSSALKSFHYSTRSQSHLFSSWSPIITRFHVLFLHPDFSSILQPCCCHTLRHKSCPTCLPAPVSTGVFPILSQQRHFITVTSLLPNPMIPFLISATFRTTDFLFPQLRTVPPMICPLETFPSFK